MDNLNVGAYILLSKFSSQLMHMTSIVLELTTMIPNIIFLHSILSILITIELGDGLQASDGTISFCYVLLSSLLPGKLH